MGFSRQEYWGGLPFSSPGDLPDPGIEPSSLTLQADSLPSEPPGKPYLHTTYIDQYQNIRLNKKNKICIFFDVKEIDIYPLIYSISSIKKKNSYNSFEVEGHSMIELFIYLRLFIISLKVKL